MTRLLVAAIVPVLLLAGCFAPEAQTDGGPRPDAQGLTSAYDALPEGTQEIPAQEPHGTPRRDDGEVRTHQNSDGSWTATRIITVRNGFGDADRATVQAESRNGAIQAVAIEAGGHLLEATLTARGATRDAAQQRLAEMDLVHEDSKSGRSIALSARVVVEDGVDCLLGLVCLPTEGDWSDRGASLLWALPAAAQYGLDLATSNGQVVATGLHGQTVAASSSSSGRIHVDGA